MQEILDRIQALRKEIVVYPITSIQELEEFRIKFLGTKGSVKSLFSEMKNIPAESKKEFGLVLNDFKVFTENKYAGAKEKVAQPEKTSTVGLDLTLPGDPIEFGSRHPISLVRNRIINIFQRLGFAVADGPEIEDDWHNFTALNMPEDHPARDMQDTFYLRHPDTGADWLLRTHTSNVQIRKMQEGVLPIRIICPGRVYRNETISAYTSSCPRHGTRSHIESHV